MTDESHGSTRSVFSLRSLPVEARDALRAEAERRRVSVEDLVARLLTVVTADDLFRALLDE